MGDTIPDQTTSRIVGGIEILAIPVTHPHDIRHMNIEVPRGRYAIVEWLMVELDRMADFESVCGLRASPLPEGGVLFQLEIKRPGHQITEWLRENGSLVINRLITGGYIVTKPDSTPVGMLSAQSVDPKKFTDDNKPWWINDDGVPVPEAVREGESGDSQDLASEQGTSDSDHDERSNGEVSS